MGNLSKASLIYGKKGKMITSFPILWLKVSINHFLFKVRGRITMASQSS